MTLNFSGSSTNCVILSPHFPWRFCTAEVKGSWLTFGDCQETLAQNFGRAVFSLYLACTAWVIFLIKACWVVCLVDQLWKDWKSSSLVQLLAQPSSGEGFFAKRISEKSKEREFQGTLTQPEDLFPGYLFPKV